MQKTKATRDQAKALFLAVRAGKVRTVISILNAGVSPNVRDSAHFNETPLMAAARYGRESIFLELIKYGAKTDAHDSLGGTALGSVACRKGSVRMIEAILAKKKHTQETLNEALYFASADASEEIVKALIKSGANVNRKESDGGTALIAAAAWNRPKNVEVLLKAGASPDCRVSRGVRDGDKHYKKTALELAVAEGYVEIAKMLQDAGSKIGPPEKTPTKTESVAKSWTRIDKWLMQYAPKWKPLKKAATSEQIQITESKLGLKLSTDLRASYLFHSGSKNQAQVFPSPFDISHYLMTLTEMVQEWRMMKTLLETGDFQGLKQKSAPGIKKEWWNIHWIPFASNGGGDYFCVDMSPGESGTKGQVISTNHESGNHKLLAPSFREWLFALANGLEDKTFGYSDEEGLS